MIPQEDLYVLLGVSIEASVDAIRSAYRKKALKCHPDKNPDDPQASETFHRLSEALKILTDAEARKAYDNVIKAKEAAAIRHNKLDAKRQKLKEDLERREREAEDRALLRRKQSDEDKLAAEIERLRVEGSKELEEQQEILKAQLFSSSEEESVPPPTSLVPDKLKIKWKKEDERYSKESLEKIFHKYGDVLNIIVLGKSALIEMKDSKAADLASKIETGYSDNPFKIKVISENGQKIPAASSAETTTSSCLPSDNDYETLVMRKLRQAEERKRLINEMMKNDGNDQ
uniref:DnaJ homolog subfamily C member 17 n=1 Tax=Caligus clemensi TaxID=344056 RepID=C1C0G3_CALCM|nr:DnaJ homolog subfamily C member 17 [Caligus clemensi]